MDMHAVRDISAGRQALRDEVVPHKADALEAAGLSE